MTIAPSEVQACINRSRDEIAWRIINEGVLEEQRTLAVGIVADEFVERLLIALERNSYLDVVTWVDRICDAYRAFPQIGSMLASACRSVIAELGGSEALASELVMDLAALEHSVCAVAFKPRPLGPRAESSFDEIDVLIGGLVDGLETIDPVAAEHSHAVSAWCERIGWRLSLSEAEVIYLARCGLVHDVGKAHVTGEILEAARTLTEAEWVMMQSHSRAGEEIVSAIKPLRNLAPVVRSHHERLDGRGYPDGLVGSQIALATRIVSVADAFNAMIARRPYRLPLSPESALERLAENRGRQFDPVVVEAMVSVIRG
jgi:HD-GYP domain-containing protein (c-di-GMP phosphodiesterase class II)